MDPESLIDTVREHMKAYSSSEQRYVASILHDVCKEVHYPRLTHDLQELVHNYVEVTDYKNTHDECFVEAKVDDLFYVEWYMKSNDEHITIDFNICTTDINNNTYYVQMTNYETWSEKHMNDVMTKFVASINSHQTHQFTVEHITNIVKHFASVNILSII